MIDIVKQQLETLRAQERYLEEQLLLTRGAVQGLEHVLATYEAGEGSSAPAQDTKDRTDAKHEADVQVR